jgi:hypothetical protein
MSSATSSLVIPGRDKPRARKPFISTLCGTMDSGLVVDATPRNDLPRESYLPNHFGGRFSANAFGPSM